MSTLMHGSMVALSVLIESLLFVATEPLSIGQLAKTLDVMPDAVEAALGDLTTHLSTRGIRLQRTDDRLQLVSAPESAAAIERLLGVQTTIRLSPAALEVLAIIAYRQPLTRAQIEAIRGVDSSSAVRALLARDLIAETGRLETVGRPLLYGTTPHFLSHFGLGSLSELPPLDLPSA